MSLIDFSHLDSDGRPVPETLVVIVGWMRRWFVVGALRHRHAPHHAHCLHTAMTDVVTVMDVMIMVVIIIVNMQSSLLTLVTDL